MFNYEGTVSPVAVELSRIAFDSAPGGIASKLGELAFKNTISKLRPLGIVDWPDFIVTSKIPLSDIFRIRG